MIATFRKFYRDASKVNFVEWGRLIILTGGAQVLVQATGFVCGILILRLLPTQEYAFYTLANTMLGTMTVLADSGISNGAMAEGGKVWQNKKKLGVVLATGMHLRKRYGIFSLLITLPILAYLLLSHGANWMSVILITAGIIPAFFAALSDSFLEMAPKLHQDIKPLQKNQTGVALGRLGLSALFLFLFPFSFLALLANSLPRIYGNLRLRKISARFAESNEQPDPVVKMQIDKAVKRTLPIVIYYCLSGQISIWLISFLGTTTNISQLGALGRVSVVYGVFGYIFTTLMIPRFSRLLPNKKVLLQRFLIVILCAFITGIVLLVWIILFRREILWVFGSKYSDLSYELILTGIEGCIGLVNAVCSQLVVSRGWFIKPHYFIIMNLLTTILGIVFLHLSTLRGVLYFNILVVVFSFLLVFIYGLINIRTMKDSN